MRISTAARKKMMRAYDLSVAKYIAKAALESRLVTYSELKRTFGILARSWGDPLGGIALRLHEKGLPLLPVIVVRKGTDMPSKDAVLYEDLGLTTETLIKAEQEKCFAYNWRDSILGVA